MGEYTVMDFGALEYKPDTSETSARQNTSPDAMVPLLKGFLETTTGLQWNVTMRTVDVGDEQCFNIKAEVMFSVERSLFGSEPVMPVDPTLPKA